MFKIDNLFMRRIAPKSFFKQICMRRLIINLLKILENIYKIEYS